MTDIYTAIMKAADHIETNPRQFAFDSYHSPTNICGTDGCALGWVAFFSGRIAMHVTEFAEKHMDIQPKGGTNPEGVFYERIRELTGTAGWINSAGMTAVGLRLYAAKYHAPAQRPPDWSAMAATQTIATDALSQDARLLRV